MADDNRSAAPEIRPAEAEGCHLSKLPTAEPIASQPRSGGGLRRKLTPRYLQTQEELPDNEPDVRWIVSAGKV